MLTTQSPNSYWVASMSALVIDANKASQPTDLMSTGIRTR